MKIAVAKYPVDAPASFSAFADKQRTWLGEAAAAGAAVAVLPEYLALELASVFPEEESADMQASIVALQAYREDWLALFSGLAVSTGMHIVAGTFILDAGRGRFRNRADLFSPKGSHRWQDKLQLTRFEKRLGIIDGGDVLKVFEIEGVRVGIAVCYDIEFPLPVRAQCESGAQLLLVPSCTDTPAGATRVRVGCLARALENRCFVAQAVTAGEAPWNPALDINTGEASIYAPMDAGFPDDGIVAETTTASGWALAQLDLQTLNDSRSNAQVANDRDWSGQWAPKLRQAKVEVS